MCVVGYRRGGVVMAIEMVELSMLKVFSQTNFLFPLIAPSPTKWSMLAICYFS